MSSPSAAPVKYSLPRPVDVAAIERELVELWRDPDRDPTTQEAITRACMSNLLIYAPTVEAAQTIPDDIGIIVRHHPARVLLLVGEANSAGAAIQANVSAFCSLVGGDRQVCSEYIAITAAGNAAERLPSVARSLLIGDLPVSLWWAVAQPPPQGGPLFQELAQMSSQIIYESQGWLDPVRGVIATADWAASDDTQQVLADLEWRRLKTWRRLISQTMDPAVLPGALESITEVRFEHGPHALPKAWLLVGWLACKLGWKPEGGKVAPGKEVTWNFRSASGPVKIIVHRQSEGSPKVSSGSITYRLAGRTTTIKVVRQGPGRLAIIGEAPNAPPRLQVVPSLPRAQLVAKQLPDLGRDNLFRETLQVSRAMAEALLH